jgi:hypothetical protein
MSNPEVKLENVRPRPVYLDKLSGLSPHSGTAIYPYVYVSRALYDNLISGNPDPSSVALVLHEQEHIERIRNTGALKWYSRYLFSPKFRLHEELAATKPQFAYLKRMDISAHLEHRAKVLSGPMYLWPASYDDALKQLYAIWESA